MIKVAIVEDQDEIRDTWCAWLNATSGFSCVASAGSTAEAVEVLPKAAEGIDVVLMDISLGEKDSGIQAVRQLRPLLPETQFMMFTVHQDEDNIFEALKAGATGYILKNSNPGDVFGAIRELDEGGSPMSMGIARKVLLYFRCPEMPGLSQEETQMLEYLGEGKQYKEIEVTMKISLSKVKKLAHQIYRKLKVDNRTEAVNKFKGKCF